MEEIELALFIDRIFESWDQERLLSSKSALDLNSKSIGSLQFDSVFESETCRRKVHESESQSLIRSAYEWNSCGRD